MIQADIPLRVRIGVVGHRRLSEPERVAAAVTEILQNRVFELFDKRVTGDKALTRLVYTVISPLAEGADRLVASAVLRLENSALEVILPLAAEDYLTDFSSTGSKNEFSAFCARAESLEVVLPNKLIEETVAEAPAERRRAAYENAGQKVVERSDMLIAVWDGKESRRRGGTAEIVAYARKQQCPLAIICSDNPTRIELIKGRGLNSRLF